MNRLYQRRPGLFALLVISATVLPGWLMTSQAQATPEWARRLNTSCVTCHVSPPKLNATGLAFAQRGYRPSPDRDVDEQPTVPFAIWLTARHEQQFSRDFGETFLPKVELISGGPIGEDLAYFLEWRMISLETRTDGTLRDRSGRFEDAFLSWDLSDRHALTIGQYRAVNQVDVSLRMSVSEPALFSTSLAGDPHQSSRIQSLRSFSPSGRSPALTYSLHWLHGEREGDGMFHFVTVPFVGELSAPLTPEARREASFELRGEAKGVFLESFYRHGLNSIGTHAFIDDGRWLVTALGTYHYEDFFLTAGIGVDDQRQLPSRIRSSVELEYFFVQPDRPLRPGVGFRIEHVSNTGRREAYIPYLTISGPNTSYTYLMQLQYRGQQDQHALFLDLSLIF